MAASWALILCLWILPFLVVLGSLIFLFVWLNDKRHRDEFVLSLLAEIQQILAEVRELTDSFVDRPRR